MRNIEDGDATRPEAADDFEEPLRFTLVQSRVGFVEDDDSGLLIEGAGDLHLLLLANGETADERVGRKGHVELGEDPPGGLAHGAAVDHAAAIQFAVGEDVRRDRAVKKQIQLLEDDADSVPAGFARIFQTDASRLNLDFSLVWLLNAGQQLHQGGLAGAIFANDRVNFAALNIKAHAVEGIHTAKAFREAFEPDERSLEHRELG